ncbi:MAG: NrsF family protein [Micropepsaceae bacterium]
MAESTNRLIDRLAEHAKPVHRLARPLRVAFLWLLSISAVLWVAAELFGGIDAFTERLNDTNFAMAWGASVAAGVLATIAAFYLSRPDRPWFWAIVPWPAVAAWLAFTGYNCFQSWIVSGPNGLSLGESAMCFGFVLTLGGSLGALFVLGLRRSYPGHFRLFVITVGLATASIAAAALPLFHRVDATYLDLAAHVAATALVILLVREGPARLFSQY